VSPSRQPRDRQDWGNLTKEIKTGGSVAGGDGTDSGQIGVTGNAGDVKVKGDLQGGAGPGSGQVDVDGTVKKVTVTGSVTGAAGMDSGRIEAGGVGKEVNVGGNVTGGDSLGYSGFVNLGRTDNLSIGGGIFSGTDTSTGTLMASGGLHSDLGFGKLNVAGDVFGNETNPVAITGTFPFSKMMVVGSATFGGGVAHTDFLIGFDINGNLLNGDAQVGTVKIARDLFASNFSAGVGAGMDGVFGTGDDSIGMASNHPNYISTIAKVIVGGQAQGDPADLMQGFGVVSNSIGGFKTSGVAVPLTSGIDDGPLGATGTFNLRELLPV
jgi:hypothetical protein